MKNNDGKKQGKKTKKKDKTKMCKIYKRRKGADKTEEIKR